MPSDLGRRGSGARIGRRSAAVAPTAGARVTARGSGVAGAGFVGAAVDNVAGAVGVGVGPEIFSANC